MDDREVERPADIGSPEQGLESEQPPHVDDDVKRNINPSRRRRVEHLLAGARRLMPGIRTLFGFQLIAVLNDSVPTSSRPTSS